MKLGQMDAAVCIVNIRAKYTDESNVYFEEFAID